MLNPTFACTRTIRTYCKCTHTHTQTHTYSPETASSLGGVDPFMILHSLNGAAFLACLPRGLSRAEGWVSNHVCDRKQAGVLAVNQTASLFPLSVLSLRVCFSAFHCLFFSHPVSPSSLTSKRFSLTSERENKWEGGVRVSLSPFTIPPSLSLSLSLSLTHTHTHTHTHSLCHMSERQLAVVCHCNSLVDCVSKSSLTLFFADRQTQNIPQKTG